MWKEKDPILTWQFVEDFKSAIINQIDFNVLKVW